MPNHKGTGIDNISYESLKYGGYALFAQLTELYDNILTEMYIPNIMKHSIIIPVYKGKQTSGRHQFVPGDFT